MSCRRFSSASPRRYRTELPEDHLAAKFTKDSDFTLTPDLVGPGETRLEGLVGEGHDLRAANLDEMRPASIALHLTKRLIENYLRRPGEQPPYHLSYKLQPITRAWIRDHFTAKADTKPGMLTHARIADLAAEKIYQAIVQSAGQAGADVVRATLDPYNQSGSADHVGFITSKTSLWATEEDKSHVNYVVGDSDWELEFARVVEAHPSTISYVKNQGLGFEVPYRMGSEPRRYLPDFIIRLDDGRGEADPLNLVLEIKGFRGLDAEIKASTMETLWVPGVNRLKEFGRWDFRELRDAFAIQNEYGKLVQTFIQSATQLQDA